MVSQDEAERRGLIYDTRDTSYLFDLNEDAVLDALRCGSKSKFINHDGEAPNCTAKVVSVCGVHHITIWALRNIAVGEELVFDYGYKRSVGPDWSQHYNQVSIFVGGITDGLMTWTVSTRYSRIFTNTNAENSSLSFPDEAERRGLIYDTRDTSYLFDLNEDAVLDALRCGSKSKFINHDGEAPNCTAKVVSVCGVHHITIWALRNIADEAERRGLIYDTRDTSYLFDLNEDAVLDALRCGSKSKFINHDGEAPNCTAKVVSVCGVHHITIWALRNIAFLMATTGHAFLPIHGYGMYAREAISATEYVYEYTGAMVSQDEAERRGLIYDTRDTSYLFDLNEDAVLDALRCGSKSKFINHDGEAPNCTEGGECLWCAPHHNLGAAQHRGWRGAGFRLRLQAKCWSRLESASSGVQGFQGFQLRDEAERRGLIYDTRDTSYLFDLNEDAVLDALRCGSKSKFINHDGEAPNCTAKVVSVCGVHHITIWALRNIAVGEELVFDYGYKRSVGPDWSQHYNQAASSLVVLLTVCDVDGFDQVFPNLITNSQYTTQKHSSLSFPVGWMGVVLAPIFTDEAERRGLIYDTRDTSYLFDLNEDAVLDALRCGSKSKFINHDGEAPTAQRRW
ncbi:SET domain [Phytophthora cactorum]|nr:SET domain [Phytophthora cactorum]